jgi:hypothetical protein
MRVVKGLVTRGVTTLKANINLLSKVLKFSEFQSHPKIQNFGVSELVH